MELLYVEQLKKRKDVLAGKNAAEGVDNEDNDEGSDKDIEMNDSVPVIYEKPKS